MNNRINTILHVLLYIICSTAIYLGDHEILLDILFVQLHNKIDTFVMLQIFILISVNTS